MEPVVMIPQNYNEMPEWQRRQIIPICIAAFDRHGHPIAPDWFLSGVAPVRKELVRIARFILGDPWCASELAEAAVHRLWARHRDDVGCHPARRVLKKAMWIAEELRTGDWRTMKNAKLYIALETMDEKIRDRALADGGENALRLEQRIMLDSFHDRLKAEGRADIRRVFHLIRLGYTWDEIAERFGEANSERIKRRFYRWARRMRGVGVE